jgi:hypothetical protein
MMDKLEEIIRTVPTTPRLVVKYRKMPDGGDQFEWGVVGHMPLLSLIGYVVRVQAELAFRSPEPTDQQALVVLFDPTKSESDQFCYFVHPDIPVDAMVGMLETVKFTLVSSRFAQKAGANKVSILGPDNRPMRG